MELTKQSFILILILLGFTTKNSDGACGGPLTAPSETIKSAGFPNPYPGVQDCKWMITVAVGKKIKIVFDKRFQLPPVQESCVEFVKLQIPGVPNAEFYCGEKVPPDFISTGNKLEVSFKVGANPNNYTGFSLNYTTYEEPTSTIASTSTTPAPITSTAAATNLTTSTNKTTVSTTNESTTAVVPTQPPKKQKLPKGVIAAICIIVILVVLLIIDLILYTQKTGVIYSIKNACFPGYKAIQGKC